MTREGVRLAEAAWWKTPAFRRAEVHPGAAASICDEQGRDRRVVPDTNRPSGLLREPKQSGTA
ncbi:hypothetical protein J31TS4_48000 [Paenibacillus sp. J31TS4]|uniref:hypothetical protein n=1 Tax=Paenibacillus sp. J31TS4 TaxID=2807195 RepID=UPI001B15738D|nr:hypothetical protein [Paenibacillus sp. J31TS4]GIP41520.1 hypothetical protein J31TS4_48000 [Paenibacillus sp. J31TS4]